MDIKSKIGYRIKTVRAANNLTQRDLADQADIDRSYIASVESGQRNVSIVNLEKITKAMQISLSDFFNDKDFK
ncbi:MAG: helix-turn-helix transcriptional regulator [Bacteroidales bacterium]|nr:helix-turn-helix transcriptional regulator [Bacteroidales bacterium]